MQRCLVSLGVLGLTLPSLGQVTSIPPFSGASTESFEGAGQVANVCWPPRVFSNHADLCPLNANDMFNGLWIQFWSGSSSCTLNPHHSGHLFVVMDAQFDLVFDTPASRFGGWFSHGIDPNYTIDTIDFYDASGVLIHSGIAAISYGCLWEWLGWSASGTSIKTIRFNGSGPAALHMVLDDLQVDFVPSQPMVYCTAGTTVNGCVASISATANPNITHSMPCQVTIGSVEGQRSGIVFYGLAAVAVPWCSTSGSSYLCVKAPLMRTGLQNSGGTLGACNGTLRLDWNAFQLANPNALGAPWLASERAYAQAWFRDPSSCKTTGLSNAVELTYQP